MMTLGGNTAHATVGEITEADRFFMQLSEKYVDDAMAVAPITASEVGYRKYDGRWPDYSPKGVEAAIEMLTGYERELGKIDPLRLSAALAMDLEILKNDAAQRLFALRETKDYTWDPQIYNQALGGGFYYLTYTPKDPKEWPARLDSILSRMRGLPAFLQAAKANLQNASQVHAEFVISALPGNKEVFATQLAPLFSAHPEKKAEFDKLLPACTKSIDDFEAYLKALLPKATAPWQLGREKWAKKLKIVQQTNAPADVIYRDADLALARARARMLAIAEPIFKKNHPGDAKAGSLKGDDRINYIVGTVIADASKRHGTPASLFADVKRYAERIKAFIRSKNLISLPPEDDNFVIERTPAFMDGVAVASFNPSPALEPWLKKSFWISSVPKTGTGDAAKDAAFAESFLREYNEYGLQTLTIHEAFPGHYVQQYWSQRSAYTTLPKKVFPSGTMAEGWGMLAEDVLYDQGYAKGEPENELFHLKMGLRPPLNAIIDQKLHTSTEPADKIDAWVLDLLQKKGFQEQAEAKRKLRRAKLTSTQLSQYFVGWREMSQIYDAAQKAHPTMKTKMILDKMMSYGTIQPALIRAFMKREGLL